MNTVLYPLEYAVAWIMVHVHSLLSFVGLDPAAGLTWALSIVGLVVVIRIILIPLFVKQIKASRGLQLIQPQMQAIQKKYKGKTDPESRQAMTQETMALYKETGTNPFASCLPILLQAPIFFALFRVLNQHVRGADPIGPLTRELAQQADDSKLFGLAPLSATFLGDGGTTAVKIVTIVLIVLMSATTFTTQRQLMMKNMPATALDNPFAKQQKLMLYVLPVVFAVSGVNFPIGVLLYWLTTNLWSMGQQFYVIRRMPAPGSLAEKALQERRQRRGKVSAADDVVEGSVVDEKPTGQRQQPKRAQRAKRVTDQQTDAPATGPDLIKRDADGSPSSSPKRPTASNGSGRGTPSSGPHGASSAKQPRQPGKPSGAKRRPRPATPPS
ncbi:membrane protein insertase YidC [Angustibacter aerolatus]